MAALLVVGAALLAAACALVIGLPWPLAVFALVTDFAYAATHFGSKDPR